MLQVQPSRQHHVDRRRLLLTELVWACEREPGPRAWKPLRPRLSVALGSSRPARPKPSANDVCRRFGEGEEGDKRGELKREGIHVEAGRGGESARRRLSKAEDGEPSAKS